MTTRADIIETGRTWLGTPYAHQHRTKGIFVDCAGLLIGVARELSIVRADFDVNGYPRVPNGQLITICDSFMRRIASSEAQPGDVVAISFGGVPQHLGILTLYRWGGRAILHACSSIKPARVVEHRLMPSQMRVCGAWAFPGID